MRIDNNGNVGIGNTVASTINTQSDYGNLVVGNGSGTEGITVYTGTTSEGGIAFADGTTTADTYRGLIAYLHSSNSMTFRTNATERMRITSVGNVGIGTSSPPALISGYTTQNALAVLQLGTNNGRMMGKLTTNAGGGAKNVNLFTIDSWSSVNSKIFGTVTVSWTNPVADEGNTATAWFGASQAGTRTQGTFTVSQSWSSTTVGSLNWNGSTLRLLTPTGTYVSCSVDVQYVAFDGANVTFDASNA